MAEKRSSAARLEKAARPIPPGLDEKELAAIEKDTMERVGKTISALESAMATWESSAEKPEELTHKFAKYKLVHEVLSRWQKKALQASASEGKEGRVRLLWEFVDICRAYM